MSPFSDVLYFVRIVITEALVAKLGNSLARRSALPVVDESLPVRFRLPLIRSVVLFTGDLHDGSGITGN